MGPHCLWKYIPCVQVLWSLPFPDRGKHNPCVSSSYSIIAGMCALSLYSINYPGKLLTELVGEKYSVYSIPFICIVTISPSSLLMLFIKSAKLAKLEKNWDAIRPDSPKFYIIMVTSFLLKCLMILNIQFYILSVTVVVMMNVIAQFTALTALIGVHYKTLVKTVNLENAEFFSKMLLRHLLRANKACITLIMFITYIIKGY